MKTLINRSIRTVLVASLVATVMAAPQAGAGTWLGNIVKTLDKAQRDTSKAVHKGVHDTGREFDRGKRRTYKAVHKAVYDTGKTFEKAGQDIEREAHRSPVATTVISIAAVVGSSVVLGVPIVPPALP